MALKNIQNGDFQCPNDTEFAVNLEAQDYEALKFCQPPVTNQYYSIGLRLPGINTKNRQVCNSSSHPYFWRNKRVREIDCVDGSLLELPRNFDGDRLCNFASVLPGSLNQIYNATWTRCTSVQYVICQLERNAAVSGVCENASTTTATTTTTPNIAKTPTTQTITAITATTQTTTTLSNNSTVIMIGSVLGVFVVLFLLWLLHFFRNRNNTKRNASDIEIHEEVYFK